MNKSLTTLTDPGPPQGPNYNELQRIEALHDHLVRRLKLAHNLHVDSISVSIETLEELVQIMADGIRTAKQIMEQNR